MAPGHLPAIGHIGSLLRDPIAFMSRLAAGPDIVTIRLGPRIMYVINSLELLHSMLTLRAEEFTQGVIFQKAEKVLGQGMIVSDGELHRKQRKLVGPALRRAQVEKYTDAMIAAVEAFAGSLTERRSFDVVFEMHGLGLDILSHALFGGRLSPEAANQVKHATPDVMAGVVAQALYPARWMEKLPIAVNRRFDSALPRMMTAVNEIIASHRDRGTEGGADGLTMLMEATDPETGMPMPERQLRDEVINLIVAGTEAVGTMLAWLFHELAVNLDVQHRVVAEIDEVIGGGPLSVEKLARLRFTKAVVNETMRRHTPTWLLTRQAKEESELGGYRIPKGGEIAFSLTALHRDPALFDSPMRFDPERWIDGRTDDLMLRTWDASIPATDKTSWRDPQVAEAYASGAVASDPTAPQRTPPSVRMPNGPLRDSYLLAGGTKFWEAGDIRAATLVVRSELDHWSRPEDVAALQRELVHARRVEMLMLPQATHFVFLDRPEHGRRHFVDAVEKFLAK